MAKGLSLCAHILLHVSLVPGGLEFGGGTFGLLKGNYIIGRRWMTLCRLGFTPGAFLSESNRQGLGKTLTIFWLWCLGLVYLVALYLINDTGCHSEYQGVPLFFLLVIIVVFQLHVEMNTFIAVVVLSLISGLCDWLRGLGRRAGRLLRVF